ncbi:NAD-dependent epimerase/dehydratase family protein [Nocardia terpenica]|uniref:NAD-dependent epimerase/dehydratase family protein n=1 Tax=Nocardia terpenica TaxID=455432 RepID=UPI00189462C1|nr:NAD-dependent epimerase/dehydratase family protein [Nocardia terpenica]MBF6063994.1 NAD-dependent epimerase/dehydratase family protein [Nocardia terpenica]MBF6107770.1 NAD-dependent epimerase/dehydratase family protein [Nocardia terpenica]MBF6114838.1 NAD-dependent epimerase/dehydratase family protein [Nocardia terpenica]MBF6121175.1 NAD-dependent epimerase/dehydratase family protein [Nocardia terpenica]MBF6153283.1 NAD-dependent epimerase/dehydratase family protein [Nocardia terpenica]
MRVLVTGAAGFIGSHVWRALVDAGDEVVAGDLMLAAAHGRGAEPPDGVHRVDVRDPEAVAALLCGVDVVCHQAAVVGAGVSAADAPAYASHNDLGTAVLLAAMAEAGVRRLVLASSMVVYGEGRYRTADFTVVEPAHRSPDDLARGHFEHRDPATGQPLTWAPIDEDSPLRPRSLYAASKVAQEHYAAAWAAATGGTVTALRYHNVYGDDMPRDTPYSGVAAIFRSALEAGESPRVFEDGGQMRDFVHVRDIAAANVAAVHRPLPGFTPLNIASGTPISIREVADLLAHAHGGKPPVVTGDYRPGDVRHIVAGPERARKLLDFTAGIAPAEGLAEFATAPLRAVSGAGAPEWR